jgi:MoxR-like ATPase
MDRFAMQFSLGYVGLDDEVAVLSAQLHNHPLDKIEPCANLGEVMALRDAVQKVRVSEEIKHYIVKLVTSTRTAPGVQLGASARASIALMKVAQALAYFDDEDFVSPEHIHEIAVSVIAHRVALDPQAKFSGASSRQVLLDLLKRVPVPA